jgi:transcriptional regulator with XRE-family HTH domain
MAVTPGASDATTLHLSRTVRGGSNAGTGERPTLRFEKRFRFYAARPGCPVRREESGSEGLLGTIRPVPLERPVDRGTRLGRSGLVRLGRELREARLERGLTLRTAAGAAGISLTELSRIERGAAPWVSHLTLSRCAAIVGLDLSARLFPGGRPFRDSSQLALLRELRSLVHPALPWATEVPLPIAGDPRAWDAAIGGPSWRYGVEAETAPHDLQSVARRIHLKLRDSGFDGVILLIRDVRLNRQLLRDEADLLSQEFPVPGAEALRDLMEGRRPRGSAIILLRVTPGRTARQAPAPSSRASRAGPGP